MVLDLKQEKIRLLHDYKQFKFDVDMIENELNDPETITPLDFPNVLIDESIDVRNILYIYIHKLYTIQWCSQGEYQRVHAPNDPYFCTLNSKCMVLQLCIFFVCIHVFK